MTVRQRSVVVLCGLASLLLIAVPGAAQQPGDDAGDNGLVLVMDASGSMVDPAGNGRNRMQAAQDAAISLLGELPDDADVGLVTYGHRVDNTNDVKEQGCRDVETIRPVGPLDRDALTNDIRSFGPSGWTPIGRALRQAGSELSDVTGVRTIVLVSDGIDTCAPPDPCDVAADLAAEGVDLTVQTVGFQVDDQARDQLECIAEATGGSYRDAPDASALGQSLRALSLRAFRTYEPTGEPITGGPDAASAAEMTPGSYLDEIIPGEPRFYSFDVPDNRNFILAAVAVGRPGRETDNVLFRVEINDTDGTCADFTTSGGLGVPALSTGVVGGPDEDCEDGGPFTARVLVEGYEADTGANQPFPLELRLIELDPGASVRPPDGMTQVESDVQPVAGASYLTAPLVGAGTYRGNIRLDEKLLYAIEVERGQSLSVDLAIEPIAGDDESAQVYSIVENGALQSGRFRDDRTQTVLRFDLDEGDSASYEPGVAGDEATNQVMERPALYYVTVAASDGPETALIDYELTLDVTGQPIPDPTPSPTAEPTPSPSSSTAPTTPTPSPSAAPTATPTPSPSAAPTAATPTTAPTAAATDDAEPGDDGGGSTGLWILLGLLVLAIVGGVAWAAGRRSGGTTTTDDTTPHDRPDGGAPR